MENLTPTGDTEGMIYREKQELTYLKDLGKWMTDQGVGGIVKKKKLLKQEVAESSNHV